ncbi:lipocalin/fatty-acid binding family protein [Streptomyces sp. NPDC020807]|uniref:lipocalin/fatty-acid binding family protein n=1 Tax=Streptomyces sp. NPDC020807 TaxID=3155119 RepID=UPI0034085208
MAVETGTWELLSDPEDKAWDGFLKTVGVSDAHREAGAMVKPSEELSRSGDTWTLTTRSELRDDTYSFTLGSKVSTLLFSGGLQTTSVFTEEAGKLVQRFQGQSGEAVIVREQTSTEMTATHTCAGIVAVRLYKKVG